MTFLFVNGDREFLLDPGEEQGTDLGVLEVPMNVAPGETIETHLGEPFLVLPLRGPDLFHQLPRSGAPMMPRDIGRIVAATGIQTGDRILDVGTGTGILSAWLGRMGADVTTVERNGEAASLARENMAIADVEEKVSVIHGEAPECLSTERRYDVITLDTGIAPQLIELAPTWLTHGGYVTAYCPFIEDARSVHDQAIEVGLSMVETTEVIERSVDFDDRGSRPSTRGVGHTGYLTVARHRPTV